MGDEHKVIVGDLMGPVRYLETDLIDDEVKAIYAADPHRGFWGYEPLLAQLIVEMRKTQEALRRG